MEKLLWVDLEMTGLDDTVHHIIEVAAVITDYDFNTLATYEQVVFQPPEVLNLMDAWCVKTHTESGLVKAIPEGKPLEVVEQELIDIINEHFTKKDRIILSGNSIGNDKRFIDRYMTKLADRLHYRVLDVSSFKLIYQTKFGIKFKKSNAHRATDDILESIRELKTYLQYVDPKLKPRSKES